MVGTLRFRRRMIAAGVFLLAVGAVGLLGWAQVATTRSAGSVALVYEKAKPTDPIARLQKQIDDGTIKLAFEKEHGFLPAVLKALNIPASSQGLVFSKTSFQRDAIMPWQPRALYFNMDTYVGWVQTGRLLEVASVDKDLGTVFYTLEQYPTEKPRFERQGADCLQCHDGSMTGGVPGLIVRSAFTDAGGSPMLTIPNYLTSSGSPFSERWGGWYVTGKTGAMKHMGNMIIHAGDNPKTANLLENADLSDLTGKFDTEPYLSGGSDLVSLLVLTHQTEVHNVITKVNYELRGIQHLMVTAKKAGGAAATARVVGEAAPSPERVREVCEPLVEALLFCDEVPLPNAVAGTTTFVQEFVAGGIKDKQGRSLRELDLKMRVFKYPCSYLIYSDGFNALPAEAKEYVYQRLFDVLTGKETGEEFKHLSPADRGAILEILKGTVKDLPGYWR